MKPENNTENTAGSDCPVAPCSPSSLTPETDAMTEQCQRQINVPTNPIPAEFAKMMERERDEWRKKAVELHKVKAAAHDALIAAGEMIYRIARTNEDYIAAEYFKMGLVPHETTPRQCKKQMENQITDKQRIDFLESLQRAKTDSEIHIHHGACESFSLYLRGNRHMPGEHNNIPARSHYAATFRDMVDYAIISENAGGMARELAAQDSESPTKQNG